MARLKLTVPELAAPSAKLSLDAMPYGCIQRYGSRFLCSLQYGYVGHGLVWRLFFVGACLEVGCGTSRDPNLGNVGKQQFLYVGNQQPDTISAYRINRSGALTAMPASPVALGGSTLIADPNRKVLFSFGLNVDAIDLDTNIIAGDGSLKMSSRITDNTLAGVRAINPTGTTLYVSSVDAAEGNWGWKFYSIESDGTLQALGGIIDQTAGRLVFTPDGTTAFAAYCYFLAPNIEQFAVATDGSLTNIKNQISTQISFGECPNAVAIAPAGDRLAAPWSDANNPDPSADFITLFNIDPGTHQLDPMDGARFPASGAGHDAVFDPSGKFLITAQDNGIGIYKVDSNSLTEVRGSPFGGVGMDRVVFAPDGRFVLAISGTAGQIFVFAFDSQAGALRLAPGSPVSTSSPYDLAVIRR